MDVERIVPQAQQITQLGKADEPKLIAHIAVAEGSLHGVEGTTT
jgi:hypothetical protein